eukprot:m.81934 g.81934  ORF g.81934 m.81934 type:complete len:498 (+) comp9432_c0_seq1:168-1661(+)
MATHNPTVHPRVVYPRYSVLGVSGASTVEELDSAVATVFRMAAVNDGAYEAVIPATSSDLCTVFSPHPHPMRSVTLNVSDTDTRHRRPCSTCGDTVSGVAWECLTASCDHVECTVCHTKTTHVASAVPRARLILKSLGPALRQAVTLARDLSPYLMGNDMSTHSNGVGVGVGEGAMSHEPRHETTEALHQSPDTLPGTSTAKKQQAHSVFDETTATVMSNRQCLHTDHTTAARTGACQQQSPSHGERRRAIPSVSSSASDESDTIVPMREDSSSSCGEQSAGSGSPTTDTHRKRRKSHDVGVAATANQPPSGSAPKPPGKPSSTPRRKRRRSSAKRTFEALAEKFARPLGLPSAAPSNEDLAFLQEVMAQSDQYNAEVCKPNSAVSTDKLSDVDAIKKMNLSCDELYCNAVFDSAEALTDHRKSHKKTTLTLPPNPDPYEVLGIPKSASTDLIHARKRRLSKRWHPDRNPDRDTKAEFQAVQQAATVLTAARETSDM